MFVWLRGGGGGGSLTEAVFIFVRISVYIIGLHRKIFFLVFMNISDC